MESPYNHWKYLTPLSVTTINDTKNFLSDNQMISSSSNEQSLTRKILEPGVISST
jgi:hypothetical protein